MLAILRAGASLSIGHRLGILEWMAENPRERLFRDDAGAAIERATRLEEENRSLRAEVDRLRRAPGRPASTTRTRPRLHQYAILATAGAIFGVGYALFALGPEP